MNRNLRDAKIRKYIRILEDYCEKDYEPLKPLNGSIWADTDSKESAVDLSDVRQGRGFGGARKSFCLDGEFEACRKEGCDTVLLLELGNSKSLEALSFLYGPEAIVAIDGIPVSGMDPNHSRLLLAPEYLDGKVHTLSLEGWSGIKEELYEVGRIGICYRKRRISRLAALCRMCYETAEMTQQEGLYQDLEECLRRLSLSEPLGDGFEQSADKAYEYLRGCLPIQEGKIAVSAALCGHGHLDLAWLWRTCQARKKGARTFLNVLGIMERHPRFRYSQTQAQLYQWMEEEYPDIFERVREAVKEGRWEILGGMWVEPDCNITGAESLARQFLLFDRYMKEKFGTTGSPVVWLPDTFGFCGQLPQIMKKSGYEYFATAKLTWNQYNKMPSEYFHWEGIDGTRVLAHIVSISKPGWWGATYSADLTPGELLMTAESLENKESHDEFLMAYGMGDGGGGPTEEMAVRGELLENHKIPGLPGIRFCTFGDFFENLKKKASGRLPVWNGELYFELHRGTYTSQAGVKRDNRLCESALHLAEFAAAFAAQEAGYPYPGRLFRKLWESVCLNQFHDILPGSSTGAVYQDAKKEHAEVLRTCRRITGEAFRTLGAGMSANAKAAVVNSTSFEQSGIVRLPFKLSQTQRLRTEGQIWESFSRDDETWVKLEGIPPYGFITLSVVECIGVKQEEQELFAGRKEELPEGYQAEGQAEYVLFNRQVFIELDKNGEVIRFFDRETQREIVGHDQRCLQWRLYEDRPADWDAWDLDEDYHRKGFRTAKLLSAEVYQIPGMRAGFCMKKRIGNSEITQILYIEAEGKELTMEAALDYQESHQLLRLDCPVEIHNSRAEYGSQFGSVWRPTHYNTSWDQAKFESCMHRWADYSEGDYGVSVLCDNKYGISIHEGVISLAVSKSPGFPDPQADRGEQNFVFVLCPHRGGERRRILQRAYLLTNPLEVFHVEGAVGEVEKCSMVHCDSEHVIIEAVKQAENGSGIIIRAYECDNTRGKARFMKNQGYCLGRAARCSILEEEEETLPIASGCAEVSYHPYEIMSIRMEGGRYESISNG